MNIDRLTEGDWLAEDVKKRKQDNMQFNKKIRMNIK